MKRFAIRNKATGKYLSTKPSWRPRQWVNIKDAALWVMDTKFRAYLASVANYPVELVEFDMFLIDTKVGTLTAADLSIQK